MTQAVIQTTVTGMQGRPIATTVPANNQAYTWSGTAWVPTGPYLPLAGGVLTGALRLQYGAPVQIFNDTGTSITAGGLWRVINSSGSLTIQSNTATAGDFSTAATAFTLNSSGGVNIGNGLGVSGGLSVNGNTGVTGAVNASGNITAGGNLQASGAIVYCGISGAFFLQDQPGISRNLQWASGWYDAWAASNGARLWYAPSGPIMSLDPAGNLWIGGGLTQASDATNKTDINPIAQGVSLVRQLVPKSFAFSANPNAIHWGFIAQDVEPIIPTAVGQMEATVEGTTTTTLSIDSTAILAAVTMAVKQIDQRLTAVEAHDGITPPAGTLA